LAEAPRESRATPAGESAATAGNELRRRRRSTNLACRRDLRTRRRMIGGGVWIPTSCSAVDLLEGDQPVTLEEIQRSHPNTLSVLEAGEAARTTPEGGLLGCENHSGS